MKTLKRQTKDVLINRSIQLFFFLIMPDIYVTAFNGVKYLFTQFGNADVISITPFVAVLITVLVYTFVFGRFFCGYACAFGFFGDVMYDASSALQKKILGLHIRSVLLYPLSYRRIKPCLLFYIIISGYAMNLCLFP